jgi:hypothetical protein
MSPISHTNTQRRCSGLVYILAMLSILNQFSSPSQPSGTPACPSESLDTVETPALVLLQEGLFSCSVFNHAVTTADVT